MHQAEEVLGLSLEVGGGTLAGQVILNFPLLSLHSPQPWRPLTCILNGLELQT